MDDVGLSIEVHTMQSEDRASKSNNPLACSICGKVFADYSNCRKHFIRHGQNKGNECEICHHLFQGRQQKLQHMMFEHGEERYEYKCQICGQVFNKLDDLHQHSNQEHETGDQCHICFEKFTTKEGLRLHLDEHVFNKTAVKCEICEKYLKDKFSHKLHMRKHTGENPFECPHCSEKFPARMYLFRHIESKHMTETPYHCELCNVSFKTIIQLRSHVKTKMHIKHQNNEESPKINLVPKNYPCPHCPKTFAQQTYLTVHLRIHSNVKPYYCPICSRGFVQVGNMGQHIRRMHQPKVPGGMKKDEALHCKPCNRTFETKRSYKYHLRVQHKPDSIYHCSVCQKTFTRLPKLRLHEATHDPNSTIKCNACNKVFFSWSNLSRHGKSCLADKKNIMEESESDPVITIKQEIVEELEQAEGGDSVSSIIKIEPGLNEEFEGPCFSGTSGGYSIVKLQPRVKTSMNKNVNINSSEFIDLDEINLLTNGTAKFDKVIRTDDIEESNENFEISNFNKSAFTDNQVSILSNNNCAHQSEITSQSELITAIQSFTATENNILQSSLSTQNEVFTVIQSDAEIKTEIPEFDSSSYLDVKEIIPEIDSFDTNNTNSQVVIYQMEDKIVEVQYFYPDPVAEEEVITSQTDENSPTVKTKPLEMTDNVLDTEDIITSLVDQSAQVVQLQSSTEYIEIKHLEREGVNNQIIYTTEDVSSKPTTALKTNIWKKPPLGLYICPICRKEFSDKNNLRHHEKRHGSNKGNECDICYKLFQGKQQVFQHKMADHGIKPTLIKCEICGLQLSSIIDLRNHCNLSHVDYPFECSFCYKRYQNEQEYEFHLTFHQKLFQCDQCEKSYDSQKELGLHYRSHTGERPHVCATCSQTFILKSHLRSHELTHLKIKPHTCSICGKGFIKKARMEDHLEKHQKETKMPKNNKKKHITSGKKYFCTFCPKTFSQQTYLTIHTRTHSGNHPYSCPICSKTFVQSGNMLKHMHTHTDKKVTDWLKCDSCERVFRSHGDLNRHKNAQHSDKTLECEVCRKIFNKRKSLTNHMITHAEPVEIQCKVCNVVLKSKDSFRKHMADHNSPSIRCPVCDTSLGIKRLLIKHMREYHNPKNEFDCETCHRRYPDESKLDIHLKCHREKPFECKHCGKHFSSDRVMQEHCKNHTTGKEFECEFCSKKFNIRSSLTRHIKTHTMEERIEDIEDIDQISEVVDISPIIYSSSITHKPPNKSVQIVISENFFQCVDCQQRFDDKIAFLEHVETHTLAEYVKD